MMTSAAAARSSAGRRRGRARHARRSRRSRRRAAGGLRRRASRPRPRRLHHGFELIAIICAVAVIATALLAILLLRHVPPERLRRTRGDRRTFATKRSASLIESSPPHVTVAPKPAPGSRLAAPPPPFPPPPSSSPPASRPAPPARSIAIPTLAAAEARAQSDPRYAGIVVDAASGQILYAENADVAPPSRLARQDDDALSALRGDPRRALSMASALPVSAARRAPAGVKARAEGRRRRSASATRSWRSASARRTTWRSSWRRRSPAPKPPSPRRMTAEGPRARPRRHPLHQRHRPSRPAQVTTARDMAILARALQTDFPDRYRFFSTRAFTYAGRQLKSTNQLLGALPGVDGMKTGYIRASGYNLVASARARRQAHHRRRDGRKDRLGAERPRRGAGRGTTCRKAPAACALSLSARLSRDVFAALVRARQLVALDILSRSAISAGELVRRGGAHPPPRPWRSRAPRRAAARRAATLVSCRRPRMSTIVVRNWARSSSIGQPFAASERIVEGHSAPTRLTRR